LAWVVSRAGRLTRRLLALLVVISGVVVGTALPASAHTVSGVGATNWVSKVTSVNPALSGLSVKVVELGNRIELRNTGPEVTVLGYNGEPYLRVGPLGVYENVNSPATYLNRTRTGTTAPPSGLPTDPNASPQWQKISSAEVTRWHDHRIHWMGAVPPPDVQRAPNRVHTRPPWQVMLRQGNATIVVNGSLTWRPGPSPWPWLAAAGLIAVVGAVIGWSRHWARSLAIATWVLIAVDIIHSVGVAAVAAGSLSYQASRFLAGSYYSFVGWGLGAVAVVLLLRRNADGLYAVIFAAASAFLFSGLLDISALHRSTAPFAWGANFDRATVIAALGGGAGLIVAALKSLRSLSGLPPPQANQDDQDGPEAEIIFLPKRPADIGVM
jgi:hypothetical protein